jgi:hypothetical protein
MFALAQWLLVLGILLALVRVHEEPGIGLFLDRLGLCKGDALKAHRLHMLHRRNLVVIIVVRTKIKSISIVLPLPFSSASSSSSGGKLILLACSSGTTSSKRRNSVCGSKF